MSVQRRCTGGCVFIFREQVFQFGIFAGPSIFTAVKSIGQTAPTHILRKDMLFFRRRVTVLRFDLLQHGDGLDIIPEFLLLTALSQVSVQDAKVVRDHVLLFFAFFCICLCLF